MADYIRLKSAASVPYKDGRHVAHGPGDVISTDDLSEDLKGRIGSDPWLDNLFETGASAPEEEEKDRMDQDAAVLAMEGVEAMTRERAALPDQQRFGADTSSLHDFDAGRTLPTNGADLPADEKFAEGNADTSENVPEEYARQYDADTTAEARDAVSEAPRAAEAVDEEGGVQARGRRKRAEESE